MEVVVTTGAIRSTNCHHQRTNTQCFTGWMSFLLPNHQCQSTEWKTILQISYKALFDQPIFPEISPGSSGSPKAEPCKTAEVGLLLQAGCVPCSPTNSLKALNGQIQIRYITILIQLLVFL